MKSINCTLRQAQGKMKSINHKVRKEGAKVAKKNEELTQTLSAVASAKAEGHRPACRQAGKPQSSTETTLSPELCTLSKFHRICEELATKQSPEQTVINIVATLGDCFASLAMTSAIFSFVLYLKPPTF
jgi:hypothetical protein